MRIELTRTGGIIPVTKKAETEVGWSEAEMAEVLKAAKNEDGPGTQRDGTGFHLTNNAGTFPIDLEKVPAKYKTTFDELKDKLTVVKPGQH